MDSILHRPRNLSTQSVRGRRARLVRFAVVGAFGTALYYMALVLQVEALRLPVMTASYLSFALIVAVNYVLHRIWTFSSPVAHRRALIPFIVMSIAGFFINTAVMALGLALSVYYLVVQVCAIAVVVTWNYIFTTRIFAQPATLASSAKKGERHGPS